MVGAFGLRLTATTRAPVKLGAHVRISAFLLALMVVSGCVYFNALYNTEQLFNRGRSEIEAGNVASGRNTLFLSIEKAERIVERRPDSRWADDALTLIVRARLLREEWEEAAESSRQLMQMAKQHRDSAIAAGYLGIAEGELGNHELADSLLSIGLSEVKGGDERAALLFSRGKARFALGQLEAADDDFVAASKLRKKWMAPRLERVRLLVEAERFDEAAYEFERVLEQGVPAAVQTTIIEAADSLAAGSPETAGRALAAIESAELLRANRAHLMWLRGELKARAGDSSAARLDYERAIKLSPNSTAALESYMAIARLELRHVSRPEELVEAESWLQRAVRIPQALRNVEVHDLLDQIKRCQFWIGLGDLGYLACAETARDELNAPELARYLFLEYASQQAEDLWAPKAILAALDLTDVNSGARTDGDSDGQGRAELQRRLLQDYRETAYVQALLGGTASTQFTYEELETGLRRQLQRLQRLADQELAGARASSTIRQ